MIHTVVSNKYTLHKTHETALCFKHHEYVCMYVYFMYIWLTLLSFFMGSCKTEKTQTLKLHRQKKKLHKTSHVRFPAHVWPCCDTLQQHVASVELTPAETSKLLIS